MNNRQPHPRWAFLSPLYLLGVRLHRLIYEWRVIAPYLPSQPAVLFGNLHAGGTGKTPIAIWLMMKLQPTTEHLTYLSRGYGRKTKNLRSVHSDDHVNLVGDEALMVRRTFGHSTDVEVIVANRRRHAFAQLPPNSPVILDDGFQHWDLQIPVSIIVCPYGDWYTDLRVLPGGPLREKPNGADRAAAVVVSRCPYPLDADEKLRIAKHLKLKSHQVLFTAQEIMEEPLPYWGAKPWRGDETTLVFSGIGNPAEFEEFCQHDDRYPLGGVAAITLRFNDHQNFDPIRCEEIAHSAFKAGCNTLLTTAKDLARLHKKPASWADLNVYYIPHSADFGMDEKPFLEWLMLQWRAHGYRVPLPL
jgi:tetraacyldisaccharide 4'-kinase